MNFAFVAVLLSLLAIGVNAAVLLDRRSTAAQKKKAWVWVALNVGVVILNTWLSASR